MSKRKTHEEFIKEVQLRNPDVKILSKYISAKNKVDCLCLKHNIKWSANPNNILYGQGCSKCKSEKISSKLKRSDSDFVKILADKFPNIIPLDDYVSSKTKMKYKCKICNTEWCANPDAVLIGKNHCPNCSKKHSKELRSLNYEFVKNAIENDISNKIGLKLYLAYGETYNTQKDKIVIYDELNYKYFLSYRDLSKNAKRGSTLSRFGKSNKFAIHNLNNLLILSNSNWKIVGNPVIKDFSDKIELKNSEGTSIYRSIASILHNVNVGYNLINKRVFDSYTFSDEVYKITKGEYIALNEYQGIDQKVKIKHISCNKSFEITPYLFLDYGTRCPYCTKHNKSRGEKRITDFLISINVNFKSQFTFPDCKNILALPFDFAVLDSNNSIMFLIEYQGEQHFQPVCFGGIPVEQAQNNYRENQYRDKIKKKYCEEHNITLIEIPYWDFDNIEQILKGHLTNQVA